MTAALLAIGDFARMTQLSVKTLRHYHDVGLLVPAVVDPVSGYRRYSPDQLVAAQESQRQLDDARPWTPSAGGGSFRATGPTDVLAVRGRLPAVDVPGWTAGAFAELHGLVHERGVRCGPDGALYAAELFDVEHGEVTTFVPVDHDTAATPHGRIEHLVLPTAEYAVCEHHGAAEDLDQTFAALGTFVADRAIGIDGPVRENYLSDRIEVCWPVFPVTEAGSGRS